MAWTAMEGTHVALPENQVDIHMGEATPPPEPGAERVTVRIIPRQVYLPPAYDPDADAVGNGAE
jgi:hypothetical protein